jgi:hypothetical protein
MKPEHQLKREYCTTCRHAEFNAIALGFEYPVAAVQESGSEVDWAAEGVDDDVVSWLWVSARCASCNSMVNLANVETD